MIKQTLYFVLFALVLALVSGCSGSKTKSEEGMMAGEVQDGAPIDLAEEGTSAGLEDEGAVILDPLDDPASDLFVRTIYFDYDSADIREDSLETVREHGKYLNGNPERLVRLEGHADERGTREYNLALGESRAKAVREILVLEGAQEEQIELVSFGEERPAVEGTEESALELNRRVELVY